MKMIPADKQEGLFVGPALAQDCGQRSRETLVRCPPAPRVHGANANNEPTAMPGHWNEGRILKKLIGFFGSVMIHRAPVRAPKF
jgi:hypothetical protein